MKIENNVSFGCKIPYNKETKCAIIKGLEETGISYKIIDEFILTGKDLKNYILEEKQKMTEVFKFQDYKNAVVKAVSDFKAENKAKKQKHY